MPSEEKWKSLRFQIESATVAAMRGWGFSFILGIILSVSAWAGGLPNDEYHHAHSLYSEGLVLVRTGAKEKALSSFVDARRKLEEVSRQHATWNPVVVKSLLGQIDAQIIPLARALGITPAQIIGNAPPKAPSQPVPAQKWEIRYAKLQEEKRLTDQNFARLHEANLIAQREWAAAEKSADFAKKQLREALAARPKSADPKLYAKVQGENHKLQSEKDKLDADLKYLRTQALRSEKLYIEALGINHRLKEEIARLRARHAPDSSSSNDRAALLKRIRQLELDNERMRKLLTHPARKP
jgi:hypothetical protein